MERRSKATGDYTGLAGAGVEIWSTRAQRREGFMEEHGKLWAIATLLFLIAIIGYVLQD